MKKIIFCFFIIICIFTSCSVSDAPAHSSELQNPALPFSSESVLTSVNEIMSGESYKAIDINTKLLKIENTNVVFPVLPTAELNELLENKLKKFISELDFAYTPEVIDFYYNNAFDTASYVFYISDSSELFNSSKLCFSYRTDTLECAFLNDYFYEEDFNRIIKETCGTDVISLDAFAVSEDGVYVFHNGNFYHISRDLFKINSTFSVFYPEDYFPVTDYDRKYVALTFDDGPNPNTTSALIKMLEEKDVKATFFMVGYNIKEYKSTVKKVYEAGHDIGIHSYGHSNYSLMESDKVIADIDSCADMIYSIVGKRPYLVRPPFGSIDMAKIDAKNYFFVNWNVDPLDWKHDTAAQIADEALKFIKPGSIVLLHDIYQRSCDAAELIIDSLKEDGYRFVTISELYDLNGKISDNKLHFFKEDYNVE